MIGTVSFTELVQIFASGYLAGFFTPFLLIAISNGMRKHRERKNDK